MAGDACIQKAGRKDLSFLGNRTAGESCRHGVAVLESHGLYAGGAAGHSHSATRVQVRIPGKKLSEQGVVRRGLESGLAAIDADDLAGEKLRFVGSQEDDRRSDVLG